MWRKIGIKDQNPNDVSRVSSQKSYKRKRVLAQQSFINKALEIAGLPGQSKNAKNQSANNQLKNNKSFGHNSKLNKQQDQLSQNKKSIRNQRRVGTERLNQKKLLPSNSQDNSLSKSFVRGIQNIGNTMNQNYSSQLQRKQTQKQLEQNCFTGKNSQNGVNSENLVIFNLQSKLINYKEIVSVYKQEIRLLKSKYKQLSRVVKNELNMHRVLINMFNNELIKCLQGPSRMQSNLNNKRKELIKTQKQVNEKLVQLEEIKSLRQEEYRKRQKELQVRQIQLNIKIKAYENRGNEQNNVSSRLINNRIQRQKINEKLEQQNREQEKIRQMKYNIINKKQQNKLVNKRIDDDSSILIQRINEMKLTLADVGQCNIKFQKNLLKQKQKLHKTKKRNTIK